MRPVRTLEDHFDSTADTAVGPSERGAGSFGTMDRRAGSVDAGLAAA